MQECIYLVIRSHIISFTILVLLQSASLLADSEAQSRLPIRAFEKVCHNISSKIMLRDWDADEFCGGGV